MPASRETAGTSTTWRTLPDGKLLATAGCDKTLRAWDLATQTPVFVIPNPALVYGVAFSPDGKLLAGGCADGFVRIFRPASGDCVRQVRLAVEKDGDPVHSDFRPCVQWLDGETLAVGGVDEKLRLVKGDEVRELPALTDKMWRIACFPDGRTVACGGNERRLVLVDVKDPTKNRSLALNADGHEGAFCPIAFSPDGKVLVVREPGHAAVRRFNVETGELLDPILGTPVYGLAFSPDGKKLAGACWDNQVRIWDSETGKHIAGAKGASTFDAAALSPDGKTFVATTGVGLEFFDPETLKLRRRVAVRAGRLALSPDGKWIATAGEGQVSVWEAESGDSETDFTGLKEWVGGLAFAPDSNLLAASVQNVIHVFGIKEDKELRTFTIDHAIGALAFSPDGKLLATGSDSLGGASIHDATTGEEIARTAESTDVLCIGFTADGKTLITGSEETNGASVSFWAVPSAKLIRRIPMTESVRCFALSPDGARVAVACTGVGNVGGKSLGIWDVATGAKVLTLPGHSAYVSGLAFAKDGRSLITASADGTAIIWDVPPEK